MLHPAISPNAGNLPALFGVVAVCVHTFPCYFSHEIVIPLICSEQGIIKNVKIDGYNGLILYIRKNPEREWGEI